MSTQETTQTFRLTDGYDRTKYPSIATYRYMTVEEAKTLSYGQHVRIQAADGTARRVKVNGNPKTWKRDAARVEVPVKYGMYEYATLHNVEVDNPSNLGTVQVRVGNYTAWLVVRVSD